jgi:hypothetical protein
MTTRHPWSWRGPIVPSAVLAVAAMACTQPQRPYTFTVAAHPDGVSRVVRALAGAGWSVARQDPAAGVVETRWRSTGFKYGFVADGRPAVIVQRYIVLVAPGQGQTAVTVRADLKKCVEGGLSVGDVEVREGCEQLDGVLGRYQEELDRLGTQLRSALASGG